MDEAQLIAEAPLRRRLEGCPIPLTATQLQWLESVKAHGSWFNWRICTSTVRVSGVLDTELLRRSLEAVVRRHESLRTRIVGIDAAPEQVVDPPTQFNLHIVNVAGTDCANSAQRVLDLCAEVATEDVDPESGPLFVAKLFRISAHDHVLICALNHLVADGVSVGLLDSDIWTQYHQGERGLPFALPELPIQFGDYAIWRRQTYRAWLEQHENYWRERLTGAPHVRFSNGENNAIEKNPVSALLYYQFSDAVNSGLRQVARRERILLPLVMFTVYVAVVSRWFDERDLVIKVVSNARCHPELCTMIGYLASQLHLRLCISEGDSFLSLLRQVNREFFTACSHEDFDQMPDFIQAWATKGTDLHFNWWPHYEAQQPFNAGLEGNSAVQLRPFPFKVPLRVRFSPIFVETPDGISLRLHYVPKVLSTQVAQRFVESLQRFAEAFVYAENTPIARCKTAF